MQGVTALHAPAAALTDADVNVELTVNRTPWDVGLILHGHLRFVQMRAAAVRTAGGQRRVVPLVDLLGAGRLNCAP